MPEKRKFKRLIQDILLSPLAYLSALCLRKVRRVGLSDLPRCRWVLNHTGCFPLLDHYYEPLFRTDRLKGKLATPRSLPGIDFQFSRQIQLLETLATYSEESSKLPKTEIEPERFHYDNPTYREGDAAFLYAMIRHLKPARIIEIGCGNSTLLAREAWSQNKQENPAQSCRHTCIEPYENPWLEKLPVEVIRDPLENINFEIFKELKPNDLLFIDSSHIIRPGGDVLKIYLEVLPLLAPGVIVHVHDIFSPRDYLERWLVDDVKFWNEQYLLEAFLSCNPHFEIMAALNTLKMDHFEKLKQVCPLLHEKSEPGSFYIRVADNATDQR